MTALVLVYIGNLSPVSLLEDGISRFSAEMNSDSEEMIKYKSSTGGTWTDRLCRNLREWIEINQAHYRWIKHLASFRKTVVSVLEMSDPYELAFAGKPGEICHSLIHKSENIFLPG